MTYSLVNTPTLGFDLCRLPGGPRVAEIMRACIGLTPDDLPRLAAAHPGPHRRSRWRSAVAYGPPRPAAIGPVRALSRSPELVTEASAAVLSTLERGLLGDLDALLRLVKHEILDWTWDGGGVVSIQQPVAVAAGEVIADALAAGYLLEVSPPTLAADLALGWVRGRPPARPDDLGPQHTEVRTVLDGIAGLDEAAAARLRSAVERGIGRTGWPAAVHDASWAVYLSGRLRPAATAQLLAVSAFRAGGFTDRDGAYGVWNAVSGLVHGTVVSDLLADEATAVLRAAWDTAR